MMGTLIKNIKNLDNFKINLTIQKRLKEFESFKTKNNNLWFSELCFCLLTANSKAITAINIQKELGFKGFLEFSQLKISNCIRRNKHRFHNNKSKYIVEARQYKRIKDILKRYNEFEAREWLVKNIKGLGYKESSHFLRNVGYKNISILDRHILNLMIDHKIIKEKPILTKKAYLEIEKKFQKIAKTCLITPAELDLRMWYLKTGKVLK